MVSMMEDFCVWIDNSEGQFMPVYVAQCHKSLGNRIIRIGHYTSIEGDIIADPEMWFIYNEIEGIYFPSYYRQDCLDVEQESVKTVRGEIKMVDKFMQAEHTNFANQWLENIRYQQNL